MQPNFVSVVVLGRFNPAILTPDFLHDVCGFKSQGKLTGQSSPVVTTLAIGDIQFFADFSRFLVQQNVADDFGAAPSILKLVGTYLEVLKYTPLDRMGLNLNCLLRLRSAVQLQDRLMKGTFAEVSEALQRPVSVSVSYDFGDDGTAVFSGCDARWHWQPYQTLRLELSKSNKEFLTANLNFEVSGLAEDRSRHKVVCTEYHDVVKIFGNIVASIEDASGSAKPKTRPKR